MDACENSLALESRFVARPKPAEFNVAQDGRPGLHAVPDADAVRVGGGVAAAIDVSARLGVSTCLPKLPCGDFA